MDFQEPSNEYIEQIVFGERINGVKQGIAISPEEIYAKIVTKKLLKQKHHKGKINTKWSNRTKTDIKE